MTNIQDNLDSDDEITFADVVNFLKEGWKFICLIGLLGAALGGLYLAITPEKYEATAHIQTAKVANVEVEAPNVLVEKLKLPLYYSSSTVELCSLAIKGKADNPPSKQLNPVLNKNAPLVSLSYKASSPEQARKCLENVLIDVKKNQNEVAKSSLEIRKIQLAALKQKLDSTEQIGKVLLPQKANLDFSDSKISPSTLFFLATTLSKGTELRDLRVQISDLEISLSEPQTKEAHFLTAIYSPNTPTESSSLLVLAGFAFIGAFFAIIWLALRKKLSLLNKK
jgi:hypothetical protein